MNAPSNGGFISGRESMKGTPAIYLGRIVDKKNFRAFIHGANGQRRLVNSWEEFEANMQSGLWFATLEDALASKVVQEDEPLEIVQEIKKSRSKSKSKSKLNDQPQAAPVEEDIKNMFSGHESVFEVTDDFLPTEGK